MFRNAQRNDPGPEAPPPVVREPGVPADWARQTARPDRVVEDVTEEPALEEEGYGYGV